MSSELNSVTFRVREAWPSYIGHATVERNLAGVRLGPLTITAGAVFRIGRRDCIERWALIVVGPSTIYEARLAEEPMQRPRRV